MSDSDIITRCPQCNTAFRVTQNQLAVADGVVRCGSCLAVFRAADNTAQAEPAEHTSPNSSITDDTLIADEEETGLELDDDIYDLDTNNKNKKTSLFDRKLQPISQQARESADESWALDMLADIKDDELEPIQIKRRSEAKSNAEDPKPEKQSATAPPKDELPAQEATQTKRDLTASPPKKRGFSFFKKRNTADAEPAQTPPSDSDDEVLNFSFEDTNNDDHNSAQDPHNLEDHFDTSLEFEPSDGLEHELDDLHPKVKRNTPSEAAENSLDGETQEELYFDQDEYLESISDDTPPSQKKTNSRSLLTDNQHASISDEDIEDAMQSRISYAGDQNAYLSGIQPAPVEMEWYESKRTQRWLWLMSAVALIAMLVLQIAAFRFNELSKDPRFRPYYHSACKVFACQLPELIATEKIRATNLVVRSHPNAEAALVIDAILINNATFSQAYPALRLEFSDLDNQLLASRDLQPADYLRGELAGATQMPSKQPIQLSLAINDPGPNAVNYQIKVINASSGP